MTFVFLLTFSCWIVLVHRKIKLITCCNIPMMVYMYFREFTEIFPEPKDGLNKSSHHQGKSKGYICIIQAQYEKQFVK